MKNQKKTILLLFIISFLGFFSIFPLEPNIFTNCTIKSHIFVNSSAEDNGEGYVMEIDTPYSWTEINSTGVNTTLSDTDDSYIMVPFPVGVWNFTFYGIEYSQLYISSNGWVSMTNAGSTGSYLDSIPDIETENNDSIALFSSYFNMGEHGNIFYQFLTNPNRIIVEYQNIWIGEGMEAQKTGSFQLVLFENGTIEFRYKLVYEIGHNAIVGLDHGDLVHYNSYDGFAYNSEIITEMAIRFTYNSMVNIEPQIEPSNEDLVYFVERMDENMMEEGFGANWKDTYGLPTSIGASKKIKVSYHNNYQNSTHLITNYSIWDSITRLSNFPPTSLQNYSYAYFKDPLHYNTKHNLTNIFPLIIPKISYFYLKNANLSDYYDTLSYSQDSKYVYLRHSQFKPINGHTFKFDAQAVYYLNGTLTELSMDCVNESNDAWSPIFKMRFIEDKDLIDYQLPVTTDNSLEWNITLVDNSRLELDAPSKWEEIIGIPNDPNNDTKLKIKITEISQNITHWNASYFLWNWTAADQNYSDDHDFRQSLSLKKDPYNISKIEKFQPSVPYFLPGAPCYYYAKTIINEDDYYDEFSYHTSDGSMSTTISESGSSGSIDILISYTSSGVLQKILIQSKETYEYIFKMSLTTNTDTDTSSEDHSDEDGGDDDNGGDSDDNLSGIPGYNIYLFLIGSFCIISAVLIDRRKMN